MVHLVSLFRTAETNKPTAYQVVPYVTCVRSDHLCEMRRNIFACNKCDFWRSHFQAHNSHERPRTPRPMGEKRWRAEGGSERWEGEIEWEGQSGTERSTPQKNFSNIQASWTPGRVASLRFSTHGCRVPAEITTAVFSSGVGRGGLCL